MYRVLVSRVTMQPEQTSPQHTHRTEEYLYIISGKIALKITN
jgi:quercetin dioxygenase-like cupin family protein